MKRILNPIYSRTDYDLLVCDLASIYSVFTPSLSLECRIIDIHDLEALQGSVDSDQMDILKGRLVQGRKGYAAYIGGKIASFAWTVDFNVKNQWFEPFVVDVTPRNGAVYVYDCYTFPAYRNKGAMSIIMKYILSQSKIEGYRDCFYLTKSPAMRSLGEKSGYEHKGIFTMRRIFNKQIIRSYSTCDVCTII